MNKKNHKTPPLIPLEDTKNLHPQVEKTGPPSFIDFIIDKIRKIKYL